MALTLAERLALRNKPQGETSNAAISTDTSARLDVQESPSTEGQQTSQVQQTVASSESLSNTLPAEDNQAKSLVTPELVAAVSAQQQSMDDLLDTQLYDRGILSQGTITVEDIVPRIEQLNSLSEMDAEQEMKLLKAALMANPAAVSLMLPEHVGTLVATLRRITKEAIVTAEKPKKEAKAKTKITANMDLAEDF